VGGFVLTRDKLCRIIPVENAAMPDRRTLDLISTRRGIPFQMQDILPKDKETFDMICKADTIDVFQIESRAQMSMLPRLKPRTFYDLEVAIVRPGPIQGDVVHPYLRRRQDVEKVDYPGEGVETALARTYGVPIFLHICLGEKRRPGSLP